MKKLSFILFLTVCYLQMQGQDRTMYWIHGFAGNNSAWFPITRAVQEAGLVSDFPARRATCIRTPYSSPGNATGVIDLATAASSLQQVFYDNGANNSGRAENAIAVAHSQGGLVTRWATDNVIPAVGHGKYFRGLVTFGSPHAGARISNARNLMLPNGQSELDVFLNQACNKLGGAIVQDALPEFGWLANLFGVQSIIDNGAANAKEKICDFLFSADPNGPAPAKTTLFAQKKILGALTGVDGTRGVLDDPVISSYAIGAPELNRLNNMPLTSNIVRVNFYGSELDDGVFFRTIHYFFNQSAANHPFEATDSKEEETITKANKMRLDLANRAIAKRNEASSVQCGGLWAFAGFGGLGGFLVAAVCQGQENRANTLREEAGRIEAGVTWMDNADDQWLGIIGAKQLSVSASTQCICDVGTVPSITNRPCTARELRRGCEEEMQFHTFGTREDHDGVVVKSSAMAMPGAIQISDIDARMEGSQHMQMRNDPNTKEKMNLLFEGQIDRFFQTAPK